MSLCCRQPPAGLCLLQEELSALLCLGEQHLKKHHIPKRNHPEENSRFTNIPVLSTEASGSFIPLLRDLDTNHTTAGVREQRCCWVQLSNWDPHNTRLCCTRICFRRQPGSPKFGGTSTKWTQKPFLYDLFLEHCHIEVFIALLQKELKLENSMNRAENTLWYI